MAKQTEQFEKKSSKKQRLYNLFCFDFPKKTGITGVLFHTVPMSWGSLILKMERQV